MQAWRTQGWKLEQIAAELNRRGLVPKIPAGTVIKWKDRDLLASGQWQAGNVAAVLQSRHTARLLSTPDATAVAA